MPNIEAVTLGFCGQAEFDGARQRRRQKPIDRRARRELAGFVADDAAEIRARGGEIRFGGELLGATGGELRFRLRDVGARHLADIEAVAGLLQGLFEHADVALLHLDDRGIAQIVHVDGRRGEQHRSVPARAGLRAPTRPGLRRRGCGWRSGCR